MLETKHGETGTAEGGSERREEGGGGGAPLLKYTETGNLYLLYLNQEKIKTNTIMMIKE